MPVVSSEGLRRGSVSFTGAPKRRRMPSNHEERPSLKLEANQNSFGIYSSLDERSLTGIQNMASTAIKESILPEIAKSRSPFCLGRFVVKDQMGITFLRHSQMRQRQVKKELQRSEFKLSLARDELMRELHIPSKTIDVSLNLDHFEWMDDNERSLAVFLDHGSEGYQELQEYQKRLAYFLGRYSSALANRIKSPDHFKILKYGNGNEINQLSHKEKDYCIKQFSEKMSEDGINQVEFGEIFPGKDYITPVPVWSSSDSVKKMSSLAMAYQPRA